MAGYYFGSTPKFIVSAGDALDEAVPRLLIFYHSIIVIILLSGSNWKGILGVILVVSVVSTQK